jgi:hypothetical protein
MIKKFNFYSRYETGHRKEYIEYTKAYLDGNRVSLFSGIFNKKPFLFLMIEECFLFFWFVCLVRSIFKFKTVGLVFRAKECMISDNLRHKLKRVILKNIKNNNDATTLSIVPFYVYPSIESVCDDWIYDFQFNDIAFLHSLTNLQEKNSFKSELLNKAKNRKLVCAIGKQDKSKGFDDFITNYINSKSLQEDFLFVSGGKISDVTDELVFQFESVGGVAINRRITDSELVALYEISDFVWASYSPDYDQSSGVLGRALQFHKPVIVRENSVVLKITQALNASYIINPRTAETLFSKLSCFNETDSSVLDLLKSNTDKLMSVLNTK